MMASRNGNDIERALLAKGFRYSNRDHRFLVLYVDDKPRDVRTKVSHGGPDYGDGLLSQVQRQLRLPSKRNLLELIDCPMSEDDYLSVLREQGTI